MSDYIETVYYLSVLILLINEPEGRRRVNSIDRNTKLKNNTRHYTQNLVNVSEQVALYAMNFKMHVCVGLLHFIAVK